MRSLDSNGEKNRKHKILTKRGLNIPEVLTLIMMSHRTRVCETDKTFRSILTNRDLKIFLI